MTGILVDTSVWVSYFRKEASHTMMSTVQDALLEGSVHTCSPVMAELLVGAKGRPEFERLHRLLSSLCQIPVDESLWTDAARLGFELRRKGVTVPLPDLLIAQAAMMAGCDLWHADVHYETIRQHKQLTTRSFL